MVSTLQLSGLTTRLAAPARLLAARLGQITRAPRLSKPGFPAQLMPAILPGTPLDGVVHVTLQDVSSETLQCDQTIAAHAALADAGQWEALLVALRLADRDRSAAPGGRRLADLISQGARQSLTQILRRRDWLAAEAQIGRFAELQAVHTEDHAAAHLLAQAHLDYGWARRSAEPGPGVPRDVWRAFLHHTALAEATLEGFDPLQEMSPLLAGTRYLLVRGIDDGDALCRDWYEDWSDLDPTNPQPHFAHAVHLLPHWFGTLANFDAEARTAMSRTRHCSGAAAYAVFYMAAADALGDYPQGTDIELLLLGLTDFARATGCQHRANIVAAALTELDHTLSTDAPAKSPRRRMVREALSTHLRETLREFHLSAWENNTSCIQYALSTVFETELARGEHVFVGSEGLTTRLPV